MRGTIVVIPLLNVPGFYERSVYINPEDGQNLNRAFPGRADGTWSERFAYHLLNDLVVHFDRDMDLHAGDMIEDLEPFVGFSETGNADVDRRVAARCSTAYGGVRWATRAVATGDRAGHVVRRGRRARRAGHARRVRSQRPGRGGRDRSATSRACATCGARSAS